MIKSKPSYRPRVSTRKAQRALVSNIKQSTIRLTKDDERMTPPVDQDDPWNGKMQGEEMDGTAGHDGVNKAYVDIERTDATLHDCDREDTAINICDLEIDNCNNAPIDDIELTNVTFTTIDVNTKTNKNGTDDAATLDGNTTTEAMEEGHDNGGNHQSSSTFSPQTEIHTNMMT